MESGVLFLFVEFEGETRYLKMNAENLQEEKVEIEG